MMSSKFLAQASVMSLALILAGCGGDESSSPLVDSEVPESTNNSSGSNTDVTGERSFSTVAQPGQYNTDLNFSDGTTLEGTTLLSQTGLVAIHSALDDLIFGTLTFTNNQDIKSESILVIRADGTVLTDGSLSGYAGSQILDSTTGDSPGRMNYRISAPSDDFPVAMASRRLDTTSTTVKEDMSGTYFIPGTIDTSITIANDLTLSGSDKTGCIYSGSLSVANPDINIFEVSFTAERCGVNGTSTAMDRNGDYFGIGRFSPQSGEILLMATNQQVGVYFASR